VKSSRVRMSEDKVYTKDSCWSVGIIYDLRRLLGVSSVDPEADDELQMVSERPSWFSRACVGYGSDIWHMTRMDLEWSHVMIYDDTSHSRGQEGRFLAWGFTNKDVDLLRWVDWIVIS
jgi:hypothetical protein